MDGMLEEWKGIVTTGQYGCTICIYRNFRKKCREKSSGKVGVTHPSCLPLFRGGYLPAFLFMTVLTQALFAFVGVHLFALSFLSAWHSSEFL
jgi:hypothetical protein